MYGKLGIHAAQYPNPFGIPGRDRAQCEWGIRITGRTVAEVILVETVFQIVAAGLIAVILIAVTPSIQNA